MKIIFLGVLFFAFPFSVFADTCTPPAPAQCTQADRGALERDLAAAQAESATHTENGKPAPNAGAAEKAAIAACDAQIDEYEDLVDSYNRCVENQESQINREICEDKRTENGTWNYSSLNGKCSLSCKSGYTKDGESCYKTLMRKAEEPELPAEVPVAIPTVNPPKSTVPAVNETIPEPQTEEGTQDEVVLQEKTSQPVQDKRPWWWFLNPFNWF